MMVFLTWNNLSMFLLGAAVIRSRRPIKAGVFYTIKVERKLRDGRMRLSSEDTELFGKSPGNTRGLNIRSPLYFGGINRKLSNVANKIYNYLEMITIYYFLSNYYCFRSQNASARS